MTHNRIIRLIADALDLSPEAMLDIYRSQDDGITADDVRDLLRDEHDRLFVLCSDEGLQLFLDGLILQRRGPREKGSAAATPPPTVDGNTVLKKLRIALDLKDDDMVELFAQGALPLTRSEITPFFRKEGHKHFRRVSDRILKAFLDGVRLRTHPLPA